MSCLSLLNDLRVQINTMIPLSKNSLSRIDLSFVLENMVENNINGKQLGQEFAAKFTTMLGGTAGISVSNILDAFSCIIDILDSNFTINTLSNSNDTLGENAITSPRALLLLPITIPYVLAISLQRMNFVLFFYDLTKDTMTPAIKEEIVSSLLEQYPDIPKCLILFYPFGISNKYPLVLSSVFDTCSKLVLSYTIPFVKKNEDSNTVKTEKYADSSLLSYVNKEASQNTQYFYVSDCDFSILIMEENNVITSATGAVVSIYHKKYKKKIKMLESMYYLFSDFNASLAHSQLKQLEKFHQQCSTIKEHYKVSAQKNSLSLPEIVEYKDIILSSFPIVLKRESKSSIQFFKKQGIECALFFENSYLHYILTQLPQLKETYISHYPNAIELLYHIIHIPLYASLTSDEVGHISKVIASLP